MYSNHQHYELQLTKSIAKSIGILPVLNTANDTMILFYQKVLQKVMQFFLLLLSTTMSVLGT